MTGAFFVADGDRFVATELTRGPWDPDAQHGGPPAALLGRAIEHCDALPGGQVVRVTCEILRPVPIAAVTVATRVVRRGRSVALTEASLSAGGTEVMRALGLTLRTADVDVPARDGGAPPPGPDTGHVEAFFPTDQPAGYHTAMEMRFLRGAFRAIGPATVWLRMRCALVAGEAPSPLVRVLVAADCGNGVSATLDFRRYVFINPDLTVHLHRHPVGEWVCLDAETAVEPTGCGLAVSTLSDERGPIGRGLQSLFVAAR